MGTPRKRFKLEAERGSKRKGTYRPGTIKQLEALGYPVYRGKRHVPKHLVNYTEAKKLGYDPDNDPIEAYLLVHNTDLVPLYSGVPF